MTHPVGAEHHSALTFERVITREAVFLDVDSEFDPIKGAERPDLDMRLEVRVTNADAGRKAYVYLRGVVECPPGHFAFAKLSAAVEGTFSVRDGSPERLAEFARVQAPVLLLPYLRAVLTDLTAATRMGAFVLPPLNMVSLVQQMAEQAPEAERAR